MYLLQLFDSWTFLPRPTRLGVESIWVFDQFHLWIAQVIAQIQVLGKLRLLIRLQKIGEASSMIPGAVPQQIVTIGSQRLTAEAAELLGFARYGALGVVVSMISPRIGFFHVLQAF